NLILDNVDAFDSIEKLGEFIGRETSKIGNPEEYSKCINLIGKKLNKILFARVTNPLITKKAIFKTKETPTISRNIVGLAASVNNWVVLNDTDSLDKELLDKCQNKEVTEIDKIIKDYYTQDNYDKTFQKMLTIIQTQGKSNDVYINDGQKAQLVYMLRLLKEDFCNYLVLINTAMSIVENFVAQKFDVLLSDRGDKISKRLKPIVVSTGNSESGKVDIRNTFIVCKILSDFWNGNFQKFSEGPNTIGIGRHSILHGRVNPNRYTDTLMIKLILLMYGLIKIPSFAELKIK
ncbi:hypothetical protein, partial [Lactobacillus crispatus]